MAYVVYEDDPTSSARIHTDACRYYRNRKPVRLRDNRWYDPPFSTLEKAWAKVRATKKRNQRECGICLGARRVGARTQVYLTREQRERVDTLTQAEGITLAEVVRRALDAYFREQGSDWPETIEKTFGAAPDFSVPERDEWERGFGG